MSRAWRSAFGVISISCAALLAAACATETMGPTIQVFPGASKPFDVFQGDQAVCKEYAGQQVAGQVKRANQTGVGEAILTTAVGAGLGAAVGGGQGAAIGAAAGGVVGADVGANTSARSGGSIQHQYNLAYSQCMYSKGNQVVNNAPRPIYARPPQAYYYPPPYPPPPPGYPPSPPPGYGPPPPPQ